MTKKKLVGSALLILTITCLFTADLSAAENAAATSPFPLQLETVVPHEPTAFVSDGKQRLVYELVLRNFENKALDLQQLVIFDADDTNARPVADFDAAQLKSMTRPIGVNPPEPGAVTTLAGGSSVMVYMLLSFDADTKVPAHLRHRFRTSLGALETGAVGTNHDVLQVLGPPVTGSGWLAETGLSNDNGHRRGYIVLQGRSVISRRYAFDWMKMENGKTYQGDNKDNASFFGYGQPVIAVADAVVNGVVDGIAQNLPGHAPAVPMTYTTIAGNNVQLDLGEGQYAYYMHLQPGSLRVKPGDHVKRGQVLGLVGNTGSSFAPHLHFEVTASPVTLGGEGVPYLIESFKVLEGGSGAVGPHKAELPLEKMLVDFGN